MEWKWLEMLTFLEKTEVQTSSCLFDIGLKFVFVKPMIFGCGNVIFGHFISVSLHMP